MSKRTREKWFWKTYFGIGNPKAAPETIASFGFPDSGITNEEVEFLTGRVKEISRLCLSGSRVTGEGMVFLSQLHRVQILELKDLPLSEDSLHHLERIIGLEVLNIRHTGISTSGVDRFLSKVSGIKEIYLSPGAHDLEETNELAKKYPSTIIIF